MFLPFVETYHQFDTIIYPPFLKEAPKPSVIAQPWKFVKTALFGGGSSEDEHDGTAGVTDIPAKFKIPPRSDVHEKCLEHYLSEYMRVLRQGSLPQSSSVDQLVHHICHIYDCVSSFTFHDGKKYPDLFVWKWTNARNVGYDQIWNTVIWKKFVLNFFCVKNQKLNARNFLCIKRTKCLRNHVWRI